MCVFCSREKRSAGRTSVDLCRWINGRGGPAAAAAVTPEWWASRPGERFEMLLTMDGGDFSIQSETDSKSRGLSNDERIVPVRQRFPVV